jgi:hypothetical protein
MAQTNGGQYDALIGELVASPGGAAISHRFWTVLPSISDGGYYCSAISLMDYY